MAFAANIQLRTLTLQDIPFAMRLKSAANWNQLEADWQLLIHAGNGGSFVALYQGKEVGTTTTLAYQNRFSWIGMVLVDPAYRNLGIGTALLKKAITYAKHAGMVRLDATPQGKKVYEALGFTTERELLRLAYKAPGRLPAPRQTCQAISTQVLQALIDFDTVVFGADRGVVLHYLFHSAPQYAYCLQTNDTIKGYCFGRSGSNFEQIGPIVAQSQADATDLLLKVMEACGHKPLILDVFTENSQWLNLLRSLGFTVQRPFIRMFLGEAMDMGNVGMQYAIAGPELG